MLLASMASLVESGCRHLCLQAVRWMECIKIAQIQVQMALARAYLDNTPAVPNADIKTHTCCQGYNVL
jgi:hypothetical protein